MNQVQPSDFEQFFFDVHNRRPFPWQIRLAHRVCKQGWPKVIDLPTASGKTACIDIALFVLAVRGKNAPRRIFLIVDRRVIVSEAFERAERIKDRLKHAPSDVLKGVAAALTQLAGGEEPLHTYELRGGAFRDETWVRTPLQPAVIASTVDQVGSRLLFRGYGVSENTWPVHAGLIANDAILLLDEAHCSKAFATTLQAVELYRGKTWAPGSLDRPFHFVEMTATPSREVQPEERFTIDAEDRADPVMRQRLFASKPARLRQPLKSTKYDFANCAKALIDEATSLANEVNANRIAIIVNRISTAKEVHGRLCGAGETAMLVIGRMRPLDRDLLAELWKPLKSGIRREPEAERQFIVSTQCLEVGADLDFDVLVSECASIDALQQRFGRLDRTGDFKNARGAIVAGSWQLTGKDGDPVYGDALRKTWDFLQSIANDGLVHFGIEVREGEQKTVAGHLLALPAEKRNDLTLHSENGPILLPAHLDALVQTSPRPVPEPFIEYFLHGPERGRPDVYVVWRRDLDGLNPDTDWAKIVALCPPVSSEAMPVPLCVFRKWMTGETFKDESDIEIAAQPQEADSKGIGMPVLVWNGLEKSFVAYEPKDIFPGATLILPSSAKGWDELGSKPENVPIDRGDEARFQLRRRICLRLHPSLIDQWAEFPNRDELKRLVSDSESEPQDIWETLEKSGAPEFLNWKQSLQGSSLSAYPVGPGWIVEGYSGGKKAIRGKPVLLEDHLKHVEAAVESIAGDLLRPSLKDAIKASARYHDYGKADLRFQAWLRNGDAMAARYAPKPLAKSGRAITRKQSDCGLPEDFRHELLSLLFAANSADVNHEMRDLVLHLVASHHGRCRPFPPMAIDESAECIEFAGASLCQSEMVDNPPFSLERGVADRFWNLTRHYGWWGLAYLEAMLRLADWKASDDEGTEVFE